MKNTETQEQPAPAAASSDLLGGKRECPHCHGSLERYEDPKAVEIIAKLEDESPYWLLRSLAQYVSDLNIACEREPCACSQSSLCITEWCEPCAAQAWLNEQKRLEALPPNAALTDSAAKTKGTK